MEKETEITSNSDIQEKVAQMIKRENRVLHRSSGRKIVCVDGINLVAFVSPLPNITQGK